MATDHRKHIQQLILNNIPLARAMDLKVRELSQNRIELFAPLSPNSNDKGTAFGGSIYSLLVLSGWSLVTSSLRSAAVHADVMVAKSNIDFVKPVTGDLVAIAKELETGGINAAVDKTIERGYAKLKIHADLICNGEVAATFTGTYCIKTKPA